MDYKIQHDQKQHKFFTIIADKESLMQYAVINDKTLDYYHTFVPPELRGKQIAEKIVVHALDFAQQNHYKIVPSCPFVKRIIDRHPQYQPLIVNKINPN